MKILQKNLKQWPHEMHMHKPIKRVKGQGMTGEGR